MNVGLAAVVTATASPTPVGPATAAVTALQVVTLVIALLGLIVSVVALTWQLVEHRLTGSRVKVQVLAGALGDGGGATGPLEKFNHELLVRAGLRRPVVGVRARNVGRLAVDVTGWSVKTDDGLAFSLPGWVNPPLPHRLEPGAQVTFFCAMADIVAMLAAKEVGGGTTDKRLQGEITLGTGNVVTSPFGRLPPDPLSQAPREGGGTG